MDFMVLEAFSNLNNSMRLDRQGSRDQNQAHDYPYEANVMQLYLTSSII